GTTGSVLSKHYISDLNLYKESFTYAFQQFFGNPRDFVILALLPSYLERDGSSLVYMVNDLIQKSKNPESGFYLHNTTELIEKLNQLEASGKKTLLLGVSYALLDLIEKQPFKLKHTIIMETGGMKGKRREMVKEELHDILKKGFGVSKIYSEYGMTELLSQAYSIGEGIYKCPSWMKVLTRDTEDALSLVKGKTGGINIIDLANYHSCSFIATQDLGKVYNDESFEILGRFDVSDIRGCNLMVQ
ncbi:MAG: acyl transferase, partial [Flavobacteriaceae bacterium]|nr:acyl transferase [Flavobacteriaceae bacterium]